MGPTLNDMPLEDFRRHGHVVVDWIAEYLRRVDSYPVLPLVAPGDIRGELEGLVTEEGESFEQLLEDFDRRIIPGITHWNHPGFFAYFPTTASGPAILAEMLSAAVNVNLMVWKSSPAGTELEEHTLDLLRRLLGLPSEIFGTINDTASSSSLYALAAARESAFPAGREHGLFGVAAGRIYTSEESHSSIVKAAITLGFGLSGVRRIETDDEFRMDPAALRSAIFLSISLWFYSSQAFPQNRISKCLTGTSSSLLPFTGWNRFLSGLLLHFGALVEMRALSRRLQHHK